MVFALLLNTLHPPKVARAAAELEQTVNAYKQHQDWSQQLEQARIYLKGEAASDPDMAGKDVLQGAGVCHLVGRNPPHVTVKPNRSNRVNVIYCRHHQASPRHCGTQQRLAF
jgi:hypothetical protein